MLACLITSLVILIFGISYAKVYVHHQAQVSAYLDASTLTPTALTKSLT